MRIVFMGSPAEVVSPLEYLFSEGPAQDTHLVGVVSQPARPAGRGGQLQDPPVASWAKSKNIPCLQPESAKAEDFLEALRQLKPDVIITAAYGQILTDAFLKIPSRATINIHPSKLPQYRGATPVPAALLDGLTETSVSILFTVKKLDAGNIILQKSYEISPLERSGELTARLFRESGPLLMTALQKLKDRSFEGTPQNDSDATFCKKIDKESGEVDWNLSAQAILNRFRAYEPWPGSWTTLVDRRIVISDMKALNDKTGAGQPGTFAWDKPTKSLVVTTGKGLIQVLQLKPAAGKQMDAAGFWNGLKDKQNLVFLKGPSTP